MASTQLLLVCLLLGCGSAAGHSTDSPGVNRDSGSDGSAATTPSVVSDATATSDASPDDASADSRLEERLAGMEQRLVEQSARLEEALSMLSRVAETLSELQLNGKGRTDGAAAEPWPSDRPSSLVGHVLGEPCRVDFECSSLLTNTRCGDRGRCTCDVGLLRGPGETCHPAPTLGGECRTDQHCEMGTPHAVCSPERICQCPPDLMTLHGQCRQFPRLQERCRTGADCQQATPYAVCSPHQRRCVCPRGFWNLDNIQCRPGVPSGRPCLYDRDCTTMQKITTCISGVCQVRRCDPHVGAADRFRLVGGSSCSNGYVEFTYDAGQSWRFLCDSNWTREDATVLCADMGFDWGEPRSSPSASSSNVTRFLWVEDLRCAGTEPSLTVCIWHEQRTSCAVSEVAAVECYRRPTEPPSTETPTGAAALHASVAGGDGGTGAVGHVDDDGGDDDDHTDYMITG